MTATSPAPLATGLPQLRPHWPMLLVTLLALASLLVVGQVLQQRREQSLNSVFLHETHHLSTHVESHISGISKMLQAGTAVLAGAEPVEPAVWTAFVDKLELAHSYPGVQGVGFALREPVPQGAAQPAEVRQPGSADTGTSPQGERGETARITYLAPTGERNLRGLGHDMHTESTLSAAMDQARDDGGVSFSGKVKLSQDGAAGSATGVLAFSPVYRDDTPTHTLNQRRAALVGWVYSPLHVSDMLSSVLADEAAGIRLQLFDGDSTAPEQLLFDSLGEAATTVLATGDQPMLTETLALGGRTWTLHYTALPEFAVHHTSLPVWAETAVLLLIAGLVLGLSAALINTRRRAHAIAQQLSAELGVSEQRYNALFASAHVPMLLIDPARGQILEANKAAEHFYGHSIGQLKAMTIGQINTLPPERVASEMQQAFTEQRSHFNFQHRLADGRIRDVEVHAGPMVAAGRQLLYSIVLDVTQQHEAEAAMLQQSQRMANVLWGTGAGTWEWNVQTGETRFNERWAELIGYTLDELAPTSIATWEAHAHPDDLAASEVALNKHFAGETDHYECESRMRHRDGHWIWVLDRGKLISRTPQGLPEWVAGTHTDITSLKVLENEIRQLAYFDALTGLPNRRLLDDRIQRTMATSKRSGLHAALVFLDLDNFKPLNDTHGHGVGDLLLGEVAHRLKACVRGMDTVARMGGDEFVVMLTELDADPLQATQKAAGVAEKIRASLAAPYLLTVDHPGQPSQVVEHRCSASVGVVMFVNHDVSATELMKRADAAMYQAKEAGRNRVVFFQLPGDKG